MPSLAVDIHFGCTMCGKCCHDTKLPLTVIESIEWLRSGHDVQVICEAMPWPVEPDGDDPKIAHRRRRSFACMSGRLPVRVVVILAAGIVGACPNLRADMRCAIRERRPRVCRIYPAEINPFIVLNMARKACPPDAWTTEKPLLERDGRLVEAALRGFIQLSREVEVQDVPAKERLCTALGIHEAALANEGFGVHSIERERLYGVLTRSAEPGAAAPAADWHLVSNRPKSVDALKSAGAISSLAAEHASGRFQYLGY